MERAADLEEDKNQPSSYSGHLPYEGGQSLMLMMNVMTNKQIKPLQ